MFAQQDIPAETPIVRIPTSLIITPETSKTALAKYLDQTALDGLTDRDSVLLYLIVTRLGHTPAISEHAPYVAILPRTFDTPLHFTNEDLALLSGTSLYHSAHKRLHDTKEAAARVQPLLPFSVSISSTEWLSLWRWADDVYASRSFPGRVASLPDYPVLVPGLDSINHARGTPVTWSHDGDAVVLTLDTLVPGGSQVFNNYGAKSNEELILSYGFVEPGCPDDVLVLRLRDGDTFYWRHSDDKAPAPLLEALCAMIAAESDAAPIEHEARAYELLEEFLLEKRRTFRETQYEFDLAEHVARPHIAAMVREYRAGQISLLNHAISVTRKRMEELVDELE